MPGLRAARAALCPPTRGALGVGGAVGGGPRRGHGTASRRLAGAVAHGVGRAGRGASRAGGLLVVLLAMRLRSDSSRHALRSRRARAQSEAGRDRWDLRSGLEAVDSAPASCFHRRRGAGSAAADGRLRGRGRGREREALAGSRRRAVLQWRALDGRGRRARLAGGGAGGLVEFLASAFTWSCRRLRMADGGWLMTGARRRVALRCVALRWLVYSASGPGGDKQHQNTNSTAQGDALALDNDSRLTCVEGSTGVSECSA